ncbi:Afadin [Manis javanica]|nr:Afadin [Manis javanica]
MSADGRHEEQRKLVDIHHWNASRTDLFETSQPIEVQGPPSDGECAQATALIPDSPEGKLRKFKDTDRSHHLS